MTKKTNSYFFVDFPNQKIWGTKTGFEKAGRGVKAYYLELSKLMKKHPTFTCAVKEMDVKSAKPKNTLKGLNFALMRRYFVALMDNSAELLRELDSRIEKAKELKLPAYPTTKKWFLSVADPEGKGFDVNEALEKILEAETKKAILNATKENVRLEEAELKAAS